MTVPPMIEVAHSTPRFWRWFIDLRWIRFITGRRAPRVPGPEEKGTPEVDTVDWQNVEKKGIVDDQTSFVAEQPRLGIVQQLGASEYGQF